MVSSSNFRPNNAADQGCHATDFTFSGSRHAGGRPLFKILRSGLRYTCTVAHVGFTMIVGGSLQANYKVALALAAGFVIARNASSIFSSTARIDISSMASSSIIERLPH